MLDLGHPQTPFVFEAAAVQSKIGTVLFTAEEKGRSHLSEADLEKVNDAFELLEIINLEGFNSDEAIQQTIEHVREQFNSGQHNIEALKNIFMEGFIEPGKNFGTWAI
ncbi:MAG: hypothetical protein AAGD96_35810 [Chloroflexota bacterium]